MSEVPEKSTDASRQGRFNGIVIVVLLVVGLAVSVWMYRELYRPGAPEQAKSAPPQGAAAVSPGPAPASGSALPAGSAAGAGYALQLSPFSDVATAEDLRGKLDKLGIPSTLSVEARVQLGPFKTQAELDAARSKLKGLGIYGGTPITIKHRTTP